MDLAYYFSKDQFILNFVKDDRFVKWILGGLRMTLLITLLAVLLGIAIGLVVGVIRASHDKTGKLVIINALCRVYLSAIRGTPVLVQLMIIYYCIFTSPDASKLLVAVLAFGINSGAYVAEIFRSGILSIDNGQFEAGRSLGFNYAQTVWYIVMPQAVKNVLPALCNEFIALLKETSVATVIAIHELTYGGNIIRSRTYNPFLPLFMVAFVYWVVVTILTALVGRFEARLRRNDKR